MSHVHPLPPTPQTAAANREALEHLPMHDVDDFADAARGLIAPLTEAVLHADGTPIFDPSWFDFIEDDTPAPDSVHPSLWRQAQLMKRGGLYEVVAGLYQVRNNDIGDLTVIEGDDGLVVIDCTTGIESGAQAMRMIREHVSDKPVAAVVYTHTHADHYGGVKGVVDPADVASGRVPIIAPGTVRSFDRFAIGENVVAGAAMARRAQYAFGSLLPYGERGFVTCGIGNALGNPTISYISPTDPITRTGERRTIAGIELEFLYAPDTEAPENMHVWIPQLGALTCAENANHALHNIQTLRGARTRDARNFARFLDETLERWGDEAAVHFGPHTWPVWGNASVTEFIGSQRDTYKFIHDQALRFANKGWTPLEAAEEIELPPALSQRWYNRGYHGTVHHDVRAVYTKELGMWDGDPVSLNPHTPVETARRYVQLVGAERLMEEGRRALEQADYRWATQVLHHVVFAEPENTEAKELAARAYEQLGYQAEGPQWRGVMLTAALELRTGVRSSGLTSASDDSINAMPVDILFDYAAVHVDGRKAADADVLIDIALTDQHDDPHDERWHFWVRRGVLNARRGPSPSPRLSLSGPKASLVAVLLDPASAGALVDAGALMLTGDPSELDAYAALLDSADPVFPIVTP
ncbi:alkyl/aryl-sulfatase [Cellulomonas sp. HZM]|uniref:alkyl/aryl-sulfatase n=1 Tax=Cellulomonas sp. HZM TaxID=1454010 RepID=UPI00049376F5|nr:alkyl sulfatase dimerization domain-containing protein [Cellulomonas sp. HZM]